MIKPDSLREHLTAALPELRRDPDKLLVFVDEGSIVSRLTRGLSFEYRYTLTLIITDFGGDPASVMVPLLLWIRRYQPQILADFKDDSDLAFKAELLSNNLVDLELKIPLTEAVGVKARPDGGYDVEHFIEPNFEDPDYPAGHWKVFVRDELVAEFDAYVQP